MPEQPTDQPANVGGRPREGERPRLGFSASIDARTHENLQQWLTRLMQKHPNANIGRVIDRLSIFAVRAKFNPLHPSLENPKPKNKRAGGTSTSTPA